MSTTMLKGDLRKYGGPLHNIGLVGVSAKWSYVTSSPIQAIPILSPMHVGHPLKCEEFLRHFIT